VTDRVIVIQPPGCNKSINWFVLNLTVAGVNSKCAYAEQRCRNILHPDRRARFVNDRLAVGVHHVISFSHQTTAQCEVKFIVPKAKKAWLHCASLLLIYSIVNDGDKRPIRTAHKYGPYIRVHFYTPKYGPYIRAVFRHTDSACRPKSNENASLGGRKNAARLWRFCYVAPLYVSYLISLLTYLFECYPDAPSQQYYEHPAETDSHRGRYSPKS